MERTGIPIPFLYNFSIIVCAVPGRPCAAVIRLPCGKHWYPFILIQAIVCIGCKCCIDGRRTDFPGNLYLPVKVTQARQQIVAVFICQGNIIQINLIGTPVTAANIQLTEICCEGHLIILPFITKLLRRFNDRQITVIIQKQGLGLGSTSCPQTQSIGFAHSHTGIDCHSGILGCLAFHIQCANIVMPCPYHLGIMGIIPLRPGCGMIRLSRWKHRNPLIPIIAAIGTCCLRGIDGNRYLLNYRLCCRFCSTFRCSDWENGYHLQNHERNDQQGKDALKFYCITLFHTLPLLYYNVL